MKRVCLVLIAMVLGFSGPLMAVAQLAPNAGWPLAADEARAALLGIDMDGYSPSEKFQWRECIDPRGETLYETPSGVQHGRLLVLDDGQACFAYDDDDYASWGCFTVHAASKGLIFRNGDGSVFVTTSLMRGIRSCQAELIG